MKNKILYIKKVLHITLFVTLIGLVCTTKGFAQSTMGTDFWVTFLPNHDGVSIELSLIAAGARACSGTVYNPSSNWSQSFNVSVGNTTIIPIPKEQAYSHFVSDHVINTGLHITSTDTISLYASNFKQYTFDVTDVLPTESLGSEYVIQNFPPGGKGISFSMAHDDGEKAPGDCTEFVIVAAENDTHLSITLACNSENGHYANQPFSITLNAGQCYQVKSVAHGDLSGSQISSTNDKKVAVFAGNECANIPSDSYCCCDHIVEQMMPVSSWGQKFVITNSKMRTKDVICITALNNNCQVKKNGSLLTTINARQTYKFEITSNTPSSYIETSEPAMVYLYYTGSSYGGSNGDPSMVIISPIEQRINNVTFSTFNSGTSQYHYVNVVIDSDDIPNMKLDGNSIASQFQTVEGNSDYSFARVQVSHGSHTLSNQNGGFIAHVYGLGEDESYAYSVGSMALNLTSQLLVDGQMAADFPNGFSYCAEEATNFDLTLNFTPSQTLWDFGDGQSGTGYPVSHTYAHSGDYQVTCGIYRSENGQDVLVSTLTTILHIDQAALSINGLTQLAIASDLWPGVYNYCIADSAELSSCTIAWECSNPNWLTIPSNSPYWCTLIATTIGNATLTATATCNSGCNAEYSLEINASYFDVDETGTEDVSIYPNPTSTTVTIQARRLSRVRFFNNAGNMVKECAFKEIDKVNIDIVELKQGVYFVDIITANGNTNKCLIKL